MSRSIAFVRFSDGTIFHACYNGTTNFLSPWLISPEDMDEKFGTIYAFDDFNYANYDDRHIDPDEITDSEDVEVYIDFGFCWKGCKASRSRLYITSPLHSDDNERLPYIHQWVSDYTNDMGYGIEDSYTGTDENGEEEPVNETI